MSVSFIPVKYLCVLFLSYCDAYFLSLYTVVSMFFYTFEKIYFYVFSFSFSKQCKKQDLRDLRD